MCDENETALLATALNSIQPNQETVDEIKTLTLRRLQQITHTMGLTPDHFEEAQQNAKRAMDGSMDAILTGQIQRVTRVLTDLSDPLVRARVVSLLDALVDG